MKEGWIPFLNSGCLCCHCFQEQDVYGTVFKKQNAFVVALSRNEICFEKQDFCITVSVVLFS